MFKKTLSCLVMVGRIFFPPLLFMPMPVAAFTVPETHCITPGCDDPAPSNSTPSYTPSGPTQEELRQQREAKDLNEAAQDADDKGVAAYEKGDYAGAVRYFSEAISYAPDDNDIKHNLQRAQQRLRDAEAVRRAEQERQAELERQRKQAAAWQQLNCASYIAGFALGALQKMGDYQEFGTLSIEAMKALDGQRTSVECPAASAMPDLKGRTVDMEQVQGKQKQILDRAGKIAERMKQTEGKKPEAKASEAAPANETEIEKVRRVQKELNETNTRPIHNQQEEKDRKELTKLILENEKLISVDFNDSEETPMPRRKHTEVPSPTR